MSEYRTVLERTRSRFPTPGLTLEDVLRRRDRRRRNQRLAAGTVGVAIAILAILVGTSVIRADEPNPATPKLPFKHNGVIAFLGGDTATLFDPRTGGRSMLNLRTGRGAFPDSSVIEWSPDGTKFAFMAERSTVRVFDLETGANSAIVPCVSTQPDYPGSGCPMYLAWSPDGSRIALGGPGGLDLVDPDGSNRLALIDLDGDGGYVGPVDWSPEGTVIAFTAGFRGSPDRQAIYVIDADGSNLRVLFDQPGSSGPWDVRWSPDGSRIAYMVSVRSPNPDDPEHPGIIPQLWIVDADGSHPTKLFEGGACCLAGSSIGLSWSPDGTMIAFDAKPPGSAYEVGHAHLYAVDPDSGDFRVLGPNAPIAHPAWQPIP